MQLSIPPVISQWISIGIATAGAVGVLTPSVFPDYVPSGVAKDVIQTAGLVSVLTGSVQTFLHRYSSSDPGPGAPQDSDAVKALQLREQTITKLETAPATPPASGAH
jgi:hypothetical protein